MHPGNVVRSSFGWRSGLLRAKIISKQSSRERCLVSLALSRERCIQRFSGESQELDYVKDLKKVSRKGYHLDRVLIVDDSPEKLERNYGNAIYTWPFFWSSQ